MLTGTSSDRLMGSHSAASGAAVPGSMSRRISGASAESSASASGGALLPAVAHRPRDRGHRGHADAEQSKRGDQHGGGLAPAEQPSPTCGGDPTDSAGPGPNRDAERALSGPSEAGLLTRGLTDASVDSARSSTTAADAGHAAVTLLPAERTETAGSVPAWKTAPLAEPRWPAYNPGRHMPGG